LQNSRIEEDLIDHLFNSVEKRLARRFCSWRVTEPRMARHSELCRDWRRKHSPKSSARPGGAWTSSWTNFGKLGFIDDNGGIKVKPTLLSVVLHPW